MWRIFITLVSATVPIAIGMVIFMAENDPNIADSNIDKWFDKFDFGAAPEWMENTNMLLVMVSVFSVIFLASAFWLRKSDAKRLATINNSYEDTEINGLLRDVSRLIEMFTGYGGFESEREELAERMERIKKSDHLIWHTDPAKQLRRDFLNRCGSSFREHKEYVEPRAEIREFGDKIFSALKNYRNAR